MVTQSQYDRLEAFRNELGSYIGLALADDRPEQSQADAMADIRAAQPTLNRNYGFLRPLIARYSGTMQIRTRQFGITSQDVIYDAINSLDHPHYATVAESAVQHLDVTLGRVEGDIGRMWLPSGGCGEPDLGGPRAPRKCHP